MVKTIVIEKDGVPALAHGDHRSGHRPKVPNRRSAPVTCTGANASARFALLVLSMLVGQPSCLTCAVLVGPVA